MEPKKLIKILFMVLFGAAAIFLFIYAVMALWNWLIPDLFNGPEISYWQAAGILLLSKLLFGHKSWGGKCCKSRCGHKKHHGWGSTHWKDRMEKKMEGLSEEEKEAMKQKMKEKFEKCFTSKESGAAIILLTCVLI